MPDIVLTIRADLSALFGEGVRVILDWYHLAIWPSGKAGVSEPLYQNLSMAAGLWRQAAHSMKEREGWERCVLALRWHCCGGAKGRGLVRFCLVRFCLVYTRAIARHWRT